MHASLIHTDSPLSTYNTDGEGLNKLDIQGQTVAEDDDDSSILTIDGLLRRRARLHPNAHAISYPSSEIKFVDYNIQQLDVFAWRVAKHYEPHLPPRTSSAQKPTVVALLGPSNLEYIISILAMVKAGYTTLLLSTRIPQRAIESLLETTGARTLLASAGCLDLAGKATSSIPSVQLLDIAGRDVFEFPIDVYADTRLDSKLDPEIEKENIVFIIHSSGSTGLPKPIYQTQKSCLANYSSNMGMRAFITLPLFHNHGICNFFRAIYSRTSIHLYSSDLPLTQGYLVRILRDHDFEIFYGVPYALKLLSETDEGIELLKRLKVVMYGGSACPDELGNHLVDRGVNLVGHYGATEVGQLMSSFRPEGDKAWNYVREHGKLSPFLRWIERGPNLYECCVADGWPAKVQSNQPDGSYATKDLFQPHPTIPRAWKYIARIDDTIVLVNGEKFNPVAMEGQMRSNSNIAEAVVFGAGRPYLGCLIVPAAKLRGKPKGEILDVVWPVVNNSNKTTDAFARVSKSMVCILPIDCAYPRTDKGSIIRQAFYKAFQKDIEATYDAQDSGTGDRKVLGKDDLQKFLRNLLANTLSTNVVVEDDTDFFSVGIDSLQAIQMRSEIIKTVDVGAHTLGQNVVFENPSIEKLSRYLDGLRQGRNMMPDTVKKDMQELIENYGEINQARASAVVVTGATGSLGAHVVSKLLANSGVGKIYCLVRASNPVQALRRVFASLIQRKVYHLLSLDSRRRIVALPSNLSDPMLGLSAHDYDIVSTNMRCLIHCAWSVNFNMHISSFEKSNIAGVNHLLSLCKTSPNAPSMNFCSSVSSCSRATVTPVPESLPDLEWAQGMGYAQSKSVAEHICFRAAGQGITTRVLRVGQIMGDTLNGVWNSHEAIPMMMHSAITIGALPRLKETPSWLPVDTAAEAISEISLSDSASCFANVTNPRAFSWTDDLLPALRSGGLDFEVVEPKEWVRRLRSNPDPEANPPIKLVEFFTRKYDKEDFAPSKVFATDNACTLSPALRNAPVLDAACVGRSISYFVENSWKPSGKSAGPRTAIFMTGPWGVGKTTVGTAVANSLTVPFIEGDSLHTRVAMEKMRNATALSDDDCVDWLSRICSHSYERLTELDYAAVVVSCSALKASYRSFVRDTLSNRGIATVFVDLQAPKDVLIQRIGSRKGHYMSSEMVEGQLGIYERAETSELDVLPVDAEAGKEHVTDEVEYLLSQVMGSLSNV